MWLKSFTVTVSEFGRSYSFDCNVGVELPGGCRLTSRALDAAGKELVLSRGGVAVSALPLAAADLMGPSKELDTLVRSWLLLAIAGLPHEESPGEAWRRLASAARSAGISARDAADSMGRLAGALGNVRELDSAFGRMRSLDAAAGRSTGDK